MNEEIPDGADIRISAQELDQLFYEAYNSDIDVDSPAYESAYQSGKEDGARNMHRGIIENGDIIIE